MNGRLSSGSSYPPDYIDALVNRKYYLLIREGECGFEEIDRVSQLTSNTTDVLKGNQYSCFPNPQQIGDSCLIGSNFQGIANKSKCPENSFCYIPPSKLNGTFEQTADAQMALNLIGTCEETPNEVGDTCFPFIEINDSYSSSETRCWYGECRQVGNSYECAL